MPGPQISGAKSRANAVRCNAEDAGKTDVRPCKRREHSSRPALQTGSFLFKKSANCAGTQFTPGFTYMAGRIPVIIGSGRRP